MRAVKGSVVSSRRISLSKAAAILARFAAAETGARPETAAYLRRASTAFDELVQFHREIKAVERGTKRDAPRKEEEDGGRGDGLKEEKKIRKKKREKAGMEDGELWGEIGAVDGRDSMEDEGKSGGGVGLDLEEMKDAKRKKKKRRREAEEEEKSNLERKEEEVEEERHGKRRKKKKKKKDKGEREEEGVGDGLDGEGRDGDRKEQRGLYNEIEWHKKKKKKERREIEKED